MKTLDSISDFIIWNILASMYYKLTIKISDKIDSYGESTRRERNCTQEAGP